MGTKNFKKRFKKARFKTRTRSGFNRRTGSGLTASLPFPKSMKTKTRYVTTRLELDPSLGSPATHVFSMNGLFDPDISGTGHQPIGFDQMMVMYDHYTVIGSRARITMTNAINKDIPVIVVAHLRDGVTPINDISRTIENGVNRWVTLSPSNSGGSTKTITVNCSPSKFFGRKVLQGDKYQGDANSNPLDGVFLHITADATVGANADPISLTVVLEYIVIYSEPKMLQQS